MNNHSANKSPSGKPANVLLITCSESPLLTVFLNLLDPLCVLQNLGGTLPAELPTDKGSGADQDSGWGTVEYAIDQLALRHILFLGHSRCCVPPMWRRREWGGKSAWFELDNQSVALESSVNPELSNAQQLSQLWLAEQMFRLDGFLKQSNRREITTTHVLWFDEDRGSILTFSGTSPRFALATDGDIRQLLQRLDVTQERAQEILVHLHGLLAPQVSRSARSN